MQEMGAGEPHRHRGPHHNGESAYVLSVDITGPLVKGWYYGTGRQAKYALLATVPIPVVDGQLHAEGDQPPHDALPSPEVQRSEEVQHAGQVPRSGGDDSPKECLPGSGAHGEKVHAGNVEPVPSKGDGCDDEKDGGKPGDALPADLLAPLPELGGPNPEFPEGEDG